MARTKTLSLSKDQQAKQAKYNKKDFRNIGFKEVKDVISFEYLRVSYLLKEDLFKDMIKDQKLENFLKLEKYTFPQQVIDFYENMMSHRELDVIKTKVNEKEIIVDSQWLVDYLKMEDIGLQLRGDGDEKKVKYDLKMWIPERNFGGKYSTHWPEYARKLNFMLFK